MNPLDELFLVLLALYLFESIWCVPAAATLFVARARTGVRMRRCALVESGELSFVRAPLLLPFQPQFVVVPWTFALAPDGIVAYDGVLKGRVLPCARAARRIAFAPGLSFFSDGKVVLAGAQTVARLDSAPAARDVARRLREIAALPAVERGAAIDRWIAARLQVDAAKRRFEELARAIRPLRIACGALAGGLVLVAPPVAYRYGLLLSGWWLLGGLLVGLSAVVVTFTRASRRLARARLAAGAKTSQEFRVSPAVAMAVYPAGAVRAVDLLARGAFDEFDPVALALAAGDDATREEIVTAALRETKWPLAFADRLPATSGSVAEVAAIEGWFRGAWERALLRELRELDIAPDPRVAEPAPRDAHDLAFCPRCRAHYATARATCADCDSVALVSFARNAPNVRNAGGE